MWKATSCRRFPKEPGAGRRLRSEVVPFDEEERVITRHIHSRVLFNYHTARALMEWLEEKIDTLEWKRAPISIPTRAAPRCSSNAPQEPVSDRRRGEEERVSRSQKKRDSAALQAVGEKLARIPAVKRAVCRSRPISRTGSTSTTGFPALRRKASASVHRPSHARGAGGRHASARARRP